MAIVEEGIIKENDGTLSFGDYKREDKLKVENFESEGDIYKVRTHKDVTRLSKNSGLLLETVPGATVHSLKVESKLTSFDIEGNGSTQITIELENDSNYAIYVDDVEIGHIKSNFSGKVSFSVELSENSQHVAVKKL
ncbi:MAG TPA: endosialidase [Lachnospiraceae bacterium]|nr:endosialidase [Lachnospiraceae bacterium]